MTHSQYDDIQKLSSSSKSAPIPGWIYRIVLWVYAQIRITSAELEPCVAYMSTIRIIQNSAGPPLTLLIVQPSYTTDQPDLTETSPSQL